MRTLRTKSLIRHIWNVKIKFYISGLGRPTKIKYNYMLCKKVRGNMQLTAQQRRGRAVGVLTSI